MPFSPKSESDIQQLSKAVGYSWTSLRPFRMNRLDVIRQGIGSHYSDNGADKKVPINLIELAMNIYLQRLIAQAPAVSIETKIKKLKEVCTRFEAAGNHLIKEIDLGNTLEMAVIGAMNSIGIIKVGLNLSKVEVGGILHDSGQPFADYVSLDDWIHDMTVGVWENVQFEGNFYYPTIDEAYEVFPKKVHDKLIPRSQRVQEHETDRNLSEGSATQREEFIETIKCLDLFLPKQNLIMRCQASDDDSNPIGDVLDSFEWLGPERGPYHKLGFGKVENNTMPIAPAMLWRDLHELSNELFRKLRNQAERQKTIGGVPRGSEADGEKIRNADDGDVFVFDNPKAMAEIKTGGIDPASLAFFLQVKDLFAYLGGNLDMLGGLGPQSGTLGQDELLSASASMRIQSMQKRTIGFTRRVIDDLLFWVWNDPYSTYKGTKTLKGFEDVVSIEAPLLPTDRLNENDFVEMNIDIEPYSMQNQTPEAKLQGLRTVFMEMIAPMMPAMQAQGVSIDFEAFFRKIAKLGNIPELNDILVYANSITPENEGEEPIGKPSVTSRNYTRRSIPGASNAGKSDVMQRILMGGKPQASEMASLSRPTG